MLIWLDLETTGLIPCTERVLEAAILVTDDDFTPVDRGEWVTSEAQRWDFQRLSPIVQEMHARNGLWMDSLRAPKAHDAAWLDEQITTFIAPYTTPPPQLAGSSVWFDRAFCEQWCPRFVQRLHYRMLDVSSVNELARRTWPELFAARPQGEAHRAMADIEVSLACAKWYRAQLGPRSCGAV